MSFCRFSKLIRREIVKIQFNLNNLINNEAPQNNRFHAQERDRDSDENEMEIYCHNKLLHPFSPCTKFRWSFLVFSEPLK